MNISIESFDKINRDIQLLYKTKRPYTSLLNIIGNVLKRLTKVVTYILFLPRYLDPTQILSRKILEGYTEVKTSFDIFQYTHRAYESAALQGTFLPQEMTPYVKRVVAKVL